MTRGLDASKKPMLSKKSAWLLVYLLINLDKNQGKKKRGYHFMK